MSAVEPLTWESTFALAERLQQAYPHITVEDVSLQEIYRWVVALPDFADDPALGNDAILMDIYREWLELALQEQG